MTGPTAVTPQQKLVFDEVVDSVKSKRPSAFFIDEPGGTGKSYVLNAIFAAVRPLDDESIAIAVASSGIAATLLLK